MVKENAASRYSKDVDKPYPERVYRFMMEYCKDWNVTTAAKAAGYSPNSLAAVYSIMKTDRFKKQFAIFLDDNGFSKEHVMSEVKAVAFGNLANCFDEFGLVKKISDIDPMTQKALAAFDLKADDKGEHQQVKMHNKLKALELLMKAYGMLDAQTATVQEPTVTTIEGVENLEGI